MLKICKSIALATACFIILPASAGEVIAEFEGYVGKNARARTYAYPLRMAGVTSSCSAPKAQADLTRQVGALSSVYFGAEQMQITSSEDQCVKVDMTVLDGCSNGDSDLERDNPGQLSLVAYSYLDLESRGAGLLPSDFDSRANYLGDLGVVLTDPEHTRAGFRNSAFMSFMAPANSTVYFLISDLLPNSQSQPKCHYKLTVSKVAASVVNNDVTAVPTLGEWSLILLGLLAAGLGIRQVQRKA